MANITLVPSQPLPNVTWSNCKICKATKSANGASCSIDLKGVHDTTGTSNFRCHPHAGYHQSLQYVPKINSQKSKQKKCVPPQLKWKRILTLALEVLSSISNNLTSNYILWQAGAHLYGTKRSDYEEQAISLRDAKDTFIIYALTAPVFRVGFQSWISIISTTIWAKWCKMSPHHNLPRYLQTEMMPIHTKLSQFTA